MTKKEIRDLGILNRETGKAGVQKILMPKFERAGFKTLVFHSLPAKLKKTQTKIGGKAKSILVLTQVLAVSIHHPPFVKFG